MQGNVLRGNTNSHGFHSSILIFLYASHDELSLYILTLNSHLLVVSIDTQSNPLERSGNQTWWIMVTGKLMDEGRLVYMQ